MIELGYKLSAEEFAAADLVSNAVRAEAAGFGFALISDHFHPWTTRQGQSPFVWTVLGAIAQATRTLRVGTAVTRKRPIVRATAAKRAKQAARSHSAKHVARSARWRFRAAVRRLDADVGAGCKICWQLVRERNDVQRRTLPVM